MQLSVTTQDFIVVSDFPPLLTLVQAVASHTGDLGPLGPTAQALTDKYNTVLAEPVPVSVKGITGTTTAQFVLLEDIAAEYNALEAAYVAAQEAGEVSAPFYAETESLLAAEPSLLAVSGIVVEIPSQQTAGV